MMMYNEYSQSGFMHSAFTYQLGAWIVVDIIICFLFAVIPPEYSSIRQMISGIQFVAMAYTMTVAIKRFLEDF